MLRKLAPRAGGHTIEILEAILKSTHVEGCLWEEAPDRLLRLIRDRGVLAVRQRDFLGRYRA